MAEVPLGVLSKLIKNFSGEKSLVHEFVDTCDSILEMASEAQKPTIIQLIKINITGNAGALVRNREFATWDLLKNFLLSTFSEKYGMGHYQIQLNTSKQGHNETVADYAFRVETLLHQMVRALDATLTVAEKKANVKLLQSQALNAFIAGLKTEIRTIVKAQKPETFVDASSLAQVEEMELKSSNERVDRHAPRYTRETPRTVEYFYCRKIGHSEFDCRQKRYDNERNRRIRTVERSSNFVNNREMPRRNDKFCNYCKVSGHVYGNCWERQNSNSLRQVERSEPNRHQPLNSQRPSTAASARKI